MNLKNRHLILVSLIVAAGLYNLKNANTFVQSLGDSEVAYLINTLKNKKITPAQFVAATTKSHDLFFTEPSEEEFGQPYLLEEELLKNGVNPYNMTPEQLDEFKSILNKKLIKQI